MYRSRDSSLRLIHIEVGPHSLTHSVYSDGSAGIYFIYLEIVLVAVLFFVVVLIAIAALLVLILVFVAALLFVVQVDDGVLFILIFGDEVPHVLVRLLELHLVHSLPFIPMQERLPFVHFGELSRDPLEHALNRSRVRHKSGRHLRALWRHRDDSRFDVVGDPRHEVIRHFALNFGDLVVHFLGRDGSSVSTRRRQIFAVFRLDVGQEVAARPHLVRQLLHCQLHLGTASGGKQR